VLRPEDIGSDEELDLSNYKGLKKAELKKLMKERERLKKRAAKEAEKAAIAERKRRRGEYSYSGGRSQCRSLFADPSRLFYHFGRGS